MPYATDVGLSAHCHEFNTKLFVEFFATKDIPLNGYKKIILEILKLFFIFPVSSF
jgi:hypothetical protein